MEDGLESLTADLASAAEEAASKFSFKGEAAYAAGFITTVLFKLQIKCHKVK